MSREVMQQALEALDRADKISGYPNNKDVRAALREAIKQAAVEINRKDGEGEKI